MRFVTAIRNSPWLIRLEGTLALSRVVVKVDAVGRRLVLLAVDKVVMRDELPFFLGPPRYFPQNDDYRYV